MAADGDVDVVYVASTQDRHVDDVLTLVGAGRNVLCEKPFALSLADAERVCAGAGDAEVFLMEALWSRFLPSYVRLAELLAAGIIGRPQLVEANFSISVPAPARADHRLYDPDRGGGALLDLGVYPVQLAPFMHCTTELTITTAARAEVETFADPSLHFQVPDVHWCLRGGLLESSVMPHAETLAIMATLDTALGQIDVRSRPA